jgi:ribosomal protein S16
MFKFPHSLSRFVPAFRGYNSFRIRFQPVIRYRKPYYRIVVTNFRNSLLACLGFYNPHIIQFKQSYKKAEFDSLQGKMLVLDSQQTKHWLRLGAIPQPFLVLWFYRIGLIKLNGPVINHSTRQIKRVLNLLYRTDKIRKILLSDSLQKYCSLPKTKLVKDADFDFRKLRVKRKSKLSKIVRKKLPGYHYHNSRTLSGLKSKLHKKK